MSDEREKAAYERTHDPARVMALSDGVFAIVITLLVLEIHVPELTGGQSLRTALEEIRPSFVAFLISFVVVAIAWVGHRDLFAHVRRTDRPLVWLNILYMLPLCLLPFGASMLARYERAEVALQLYGFLLVAIALTRVWMFWYGTGRPHLLYESIDRRSRLLGVVFVAIPAAVYLFAIVFAGVAPRVSLWIYALVPALYLIGAWRARKVAPPGWAESEA
jgi:TMEM175 potassium channel family protein